MNPMKHTIPCLTVLLLTASAFADAAPRTAVISNAKPRMDTAAQILDAHDGCLEYFDGRFYLYGTRYGNSNGFGTSNRYVCYSSPDLMNWTPHGEILKDAPLRVYFRPYVKFNKATRTYVLWYNADNQYGVATSDRPQGPFVIRNSNVKVRNDEGGVGDLGLFIDNDGTAYLTYTHRLNWRFDVQTEPIPHHRICVERLTPDYLGSTMQCGDFVAGNCESPALFKRGKTYYLLFDNTCCFGADGSGSRVYTAEAPLGPYRYRGNITLQGLGARDVPISWTLPGSGRPNCIVKAQQTHVAVLPAGTGTVYLWMGDRWGSRPDGIKGHDFQYWSSPLQFDDDGMVKQLRWEDQWTLRLP